MEDEREARKKINRLAVISVVLVVVAIVLVMWSLLMGQTTTSGGAPEAVSSEALSCEASGKKYEVFSTSDFASSTTQVNMIFDADKLRSISFTHKELYNDVQMAQNVITWGHANMNISFGSEYGADAFKANYNVDGKTARISLYATGDELNTVRAREYFMINGIPSGIDGYKKNYESQGFKCMAKDN